MTVPDFADDPLTDLQAVLDATARDYHPGTGQKLPPFDGGWIGYFSYDLGRTIEPAAAGNRQPSRDRDWPLIELGWCPDALIHDNLSGQWFMIGNPPLNPADLAAGAWRSETDADEPVVGTLQCRTTPDDYLQAVARTIEYIAAGDIFQANITQRFTAEFHGSPRRFAFSALESAAAWYGAYLELSPDRRVISVSPELFLQVDGREGRRRIVTRPIKGTRPGCDDPQHLADSAKDAAELHMIVDLMRNDLGRVCRLGSMRVEAGRMIETHRTVHHGVGQVAGTLGDDVSFSHLMRATFPGGSITGAPKIRAMQIIDELEPVQRGPYCGSIGYVSDHGNTCLNIAIRTILLSGQTDPARADHLDGVLDYSAGGGIVADSEPLAEYRESLDKTAVLKLVLDRQRIRAVAEP